MSVSGITSTSFTQLGTSPLNQPKTRQAEDAIGRQLEQDLQNGDLAGAEQAYKQLASYGPNNSGPFADPTLKADFQALGQDLQSGNLAAAQSDNSTLTTGLLNKDVQAVMQAAHGSSAQDTPTMKAAMANLLGDYWAVTGQKLNAAALQSLEGQGGTAPISLQA
jgi:hypothetical protein